ncbi:MAG: ATP-binding protein [Pseudobdellovibrio sp.]
MPLAQAEELKKYKTALKNASMGVWQFDVLTNTFTWDVGLNELFEWEDKEKFGCSLEEWYELIHTEDRENMRVYIAEVLNGTVDVNTFLRIKTKSNKTKFIRACAYKVLNEGVIDHFVGVTWDVTNESVLRTDLLREKNFSENILDAIPDPIFVKNSNHEIIYANQEYAKFVGMPKESFLGKDDYAFFPKEVADFFWHKNENVFQGDHSIETEEQVSDYRGKPRDVLTKKTPLNNSKNEKVLVGVIRDITELKRMQSSLIEKSKMASLGEMAAEIAHEINNPLMIVQGKTQLLIEKMSKQPELAAYKKDLVSIETNCLRIDKIIKSLKSVSRKADRDPYEDVSVLKLIDEAFEISKERFRKRKLNLFVITDEFIDYTYTIKARPSEIVQVLVNLLNNSYDAVEAQPRGWARVSLTVTGNTFQVEVTDSGAEIEPEIAQKMMEPFFTTKMTGKGTGLGLSVSKQIIQSHNGELFYDSKSDNTRFVFTLPKT